MALTFFFIGIAIWFALERSVIQTADGELRTRLADVSRYVATFTPDDFRHLENEFREESLLSTSVSNIRITDPQGAWLFRTPSTNHWPTLVPSTQPRFETILVGGERVRLLTAPIRVGTVQIGLNIAGFEAVKNGFLWTIGLGSPILLFFAALGGYWMSGRALRPVDEISRAATRISAEDLSARLPSSGVGDELDRLSGVLNAMLQRLQSAFSRVTEFTADASHELRTPIAVIQTTAELMQSRPRTVDEHREAWRRVETETQRTAQLIGDLLLLARSDAGKTELEFTAIDLSGVARSAAEEMRVIAEAKGLSFAVEAAQPCPIKGDSEALRRVICILLDNAIKFTPAPGNVTVSVSSQGVVNISDTGIGIPAAEIPKIFDRFYRVSKDRSRATGGAGLGLSIAHWIIARHQGQIQVTSKPQEGSTFTIAFP